MSLGWKLLQEKNSFLIKIACFVDLCSRKKKDMVRHRLKPIVLDSWFDTDPTWPTCDLTLFNSSFVRVWLVIRTCSYHDSTPPTYGSTRFDTWFDPVKLKFWPSSFNSSIALRCQTDHWNGAQGFWDPIDKSSNMLKFWRNDERKRKNKWRTKRSSLLQNPLAIDKTHSLPS